jgi:hypothetical protein
MYAFFTFQMTPVFLCLLLKLPNQPKTMSAVEQKAKMSEKEVDRSTVNQ